MQKDTILTLLNNLRDPISLGIRKRVEKVATFDTNILLYGETGVGKDFWAEYILTVGEKEKMLNLHCGDTPENLIESEWFGYKKGAFTGADKEFGGRWKTVDNGIIFLNQIDLLSINMQSKLLRIIERKKYYPLGSVNETDINSRFIFSADSDINDKVKLGNFRKDLFYRISTYSIFIPPLRERKDDIIPLLRFFASKAGMSVNLTGRGEKTIVEHRWEGNIREIENFINNISILKTSLDDSDTEKLKEESVFTGASIPQDDLPLKEVEKRYIKHLLKKYGNKTEVAKILKISRKSLYDRLNKYGKD